MMMMMMMMMKHNDLIILCNYPFPSFHKRLINWPRNRVYVFVLVNKSTNSPFKKIYLII